MTSVKIKGIIPENITNNMPNLNSNDLQCISYAKHPNRSDFDTGYVRF